MSPGTGDDEDAYINREGSRHELGGRPAEGTGAVATRPVKYQHSFFDPEVAHLRSIYFKIVLPSVILMIVCMWLFLPVYWGSLGETSEHVPNLHALLVNRDGNGQPLGQALVQAFLANTQGQGVPKNAHLTWDIVQNPGDWTDDMVTHEILEEKVWAAVVVNPGASLAAATARAAGNSSYNPQSAITFYYNQGRNEIATNSFVVPYTSALLQATLARANAQFTGQWLASGSADVAAAALAPQTVSSPFAFTSVNLRPFTKTVSTAILLVGQIYITIFAFVVTMAHDAARGVIAPFLNFKSYAKLRLIVPLIAYIPLSFSYALVNLPFKVTFGEKYSYAWGFFIFWLYVYMGMGALGLATEAMITLMTPRFIAYFLLALIIFNVSVASVPIVLQPGFYRYGYAFPVYHLSQAVRTIIFNTKNHLGESAGVLIAWIVLSCITVPLFTWLMRRVEMKQNGELQRPGGIEAGNTLEVPAEEKPKGSA